MTTKQSVTIENGDISFETQLIRHLESFVTEGDRGDAIVTFHGMNGQWNQSFILSRETDQPVTWEERQINLENEYEAGAETLVDFLFLVNDYPISIVLRTFTTDDYEMTKRSTVETVTRIVPGKEIRMYSAIAHETTLIELSKDNCFKCMNTHAETGEMLPTDNTIHYPGPLENTVIPMLS